MVCWIRRWMRKWRRYFSCCRRSGKQVMCHTCFVSKLINHNKLCFMWITMANLPPSPNSQTQSRLTSWHEDRQSESRAFGYFWLEGYCAANNIVMSSLHEIALNGEKCRKHRKFTIFSCSIYYAKIFSIVLSIIPGRPVTEQENVVSWCDSVNAFNDLIVR